MKTTLDAEDILYKYLDESSLKTAVAVNGGTIWKSRRPTNDKKEAVVIVSLPINNQRLQEGVVNVNIFVPNLEIKYGGVQDDSQPNHSRLKTLTALAVGLLDEVFIPNSNCGFDVEQQVLFQDDLSKEHYVNIRVRFYNDN